MGVQGERSDHRRLLRSRKQPKWGQGSGVSLWERLGRELEVEKGVLRADGGGSTRGASLPSLL